MKSKAPIIIPAYDTSDDVTARSAYDFTHSDIINTLSYEDIIRHFGSKKDTINYYKEILAAGYPRSAAFLITKILKGSITAVGQKAAKKILLNDLSMLTVENLATSADTLISKIAKPTNKKKILFSSGHWLTGGMERVMSVLFGELKDEYEIFLITPFTEVESRIDVPDFVTHIKINSDLFVKHFDSLILSYALLLNIDVVIGYMNMFEKQLNLYNLCIGTKIKTIASNHEYYFYPYKSPGHYQVVEKRLNAFAKCDAIVWANNFNAALCGMYVENSYVIGNPNTFEINDRIKGRPTENIILCVGRFNDYVKRIDRMLECFSLVLKKQPDAKLVLVGKCDTNTPIRPNDKTTVNDMISKLSIPTGSVNFVGEVNNVQDYFSKAKVLMLTSNSEGFGMVLNEAACFGVPSVSNYIPGIEDIIKDGVNGYITEQDDIDSMALKICEVLANDSLQNELSENAKKMVNRFDSAHIGAKWKLLIDGLIEVKGKDKLHKKLADTIGFKIADPKLFLSVVSRELNEIFYQAIDDSNKHRFGKTLLMLSKIKTLPRRLSANVKYEGIFNTGKKVVVRSYLMARNKIFRT